MKFNKIFLSAIALAVVTMTSCTSDEDIPQLPISQGSGDRAISFSSYSSTTAGSRALPMTSDLLKNTGFGIFAYNTGTELFSERSDMNFMVNQGISWEAGSSVWTYSPVKYWPIGSGANLSFIAYAPYSSDLMSNSTNALTYNGEASGGAPTLTYTLPDDPFQHIDLLYSNENINKKFKDNMGKVNFQFKHALCLFDIGLYHRMPGAEVTVDKIILKNTNNQPIATKANFDLYSGFWDLDNAIYDKTYSITLDADDMRTNQVSYGSSGNDFLKDGHYIMLIPNNEGSLNSINVEIQYTVKIPDPNIAGGYAVTQNTHLVTVSTYLEKGKKTKASIALSSYDVKVNSVISSDWE